MNSIESIFLKRLLARIVSERETRLNALLDRKSYEDYVNRIGYIKALTDVIDMCDDVHRELTSPEK